MEIRDVELPGVGHKYTLQTDQGKRLTLILHNTGERELLLFEAGKDVPAATVQLGEEDGRRIGAILSGAFYQPTGRARLEAVLGELTFLWHEVTGEPLAGHTVGELELRRRTGAGVVARLRDGSPPVINPGPELDLRSGDTLIVVGERKQVEAFRAFAGG